MYNAYKNAPRFVRGAFVMLRYQSLFAVLISSGVLLCNVVVV